MTIPAISHYRGGTIDEVAPLAKTLKAYYLKHRVAYRLSRFQTGPNAGDWFVVVQYADQTAYERRRQFLPKTPNANRPLSRLQSSRRGLAEKWSSISIFDSEFPTLLRNL
jgi:hypothetical protein